MIAKGRVSTNESAKAPNTTLDAMPAWAANDLRLDPYALPQRVGYERAMLSARSGAVEFTLDNKGAVMKREMTCGLPLSMALPARAFQGIAARVYEDAVGGHTVTLELLHSDADLSVPLCSSPTVEDAASDWHSWSKQMGLPMLLIDEAGVATVVKDHSGLTSQAPKPRRRRAMHKHRPNFMRRRKVGIVGPVVRITGQEIIART